MAALDLEEQEQLAQLKAWWQRFGGQVLTGITIVMLVIAGYNGWNYYQRAQSGAAAKVFEGLQRLAEGRDVKKVSEASKALADQYPRSVFSAMGNLIAARISFDGKDLASARAQLQWVLDNGKDDELKHLARIRLAGILLDQKELEPARKLLETPHPPHFDAAYADRRGDIFHAMGKIAEARGAWETALAKAGTANSLKATLEFKLDMIGAAPPATGS